MVGNHVERLSNKWLVITWNDYQIKAGNHVEWLSNKWLVIIWNGYQIKSTRTSKQRC